MQKMRGGVITLCKHCQDEMVVGKESLTAGKAPNKNPTAQWAQARN